MLFYSVCVSRMLSMKCPLLESSSHVVCVLIRNRRKTRISWEHVTRMDQSIGSKYSMLVITLLTCEAKRKHNKKEHKTFCFFPPLITPWGTSKHTHKKKNIFSFFFSSGLSLICHNSCCDVKLIRKVINKVK